MINWLIQTLVLIHAVSFLINDLISITGLWVIYHGSYTFSDTMSTKTEHLSALTKRVNLKCHLGAIWLEQSMIINPDIDRI